MLLTFAAVAVPVPLYAEYKMALGLTDADISLTMVSYLTGVLTTLFIGGSLSGCARSQAARGRRSAIRLASLRAVYLASQRSRLANPPVWCKACRAASP